jgi:hypothetical protein
MDLEDLDKLADRQSRLKRSAKNKQTNYKESSFLNVIQGDNDGDSSSEGDDGDGGEGKKSTKSKKGGATPLVAPVNKVKAWTLKELRALASGIGQYGIGEFTQVLSTAAALQGSKSAQLDYSPAFERVYQDVILAGPKQKKEAPNSAQWSKLEVEEMGCWLLFTYMQMLDKSSPKPKPQSTASAATTEASTTAATDAAAPSEEKTSQSEVDDTAATMVDSAETSSTTVNESADGVDAAKSSSSSSSSSNKTSSTKAIPLEDFTSLLNDYPWCRAVVASLCYFVDKKCMPTTVTSAPAVSLVTQPSNESVSSSSSTLPVTTNEEPMSQSMSNNADDGARVLEEVHVATGSTAAPLAQSAPMVRLGPLATQFFPLLSSMTKGGALSLPQPPKQVAAAVVVVEGGGGGGGDSSAMQDEEKSDHLKIEDLSMILRRHTPEVLMPISSSSALSATGSFSFGTAASPFHLPLAQAKKNLKSMDEYWYFSAAFKLAILEEGSNKKGTEDEMLDDDEMKKKEIEAVSTTTLTFDKLCSQIRTNIPATWWTMEHDMALMRCVNKHGMILTSKKYEVCCSDEDVQWPAPLDAKLGASGMNVDASQDSTSVAQAETENVSDEVVLAATSTGVTESATSEHKEENAETEDKMEDDKEDTSVALQKQDDDEAAAAAAVVVDVCDALSSAPVAGLTTQPFPKREVLMKRIQSIIKVMKSPKEPKSSNTSNVGSASQTGKKEGGSGNKRARASGKEGGESKSKKAAPLNMKLVRDDANSKSWLQSFCTTFPTTSKVQPKASSLSLESVSENDDSQATSQEASSADTESKLSQSETSKTSIDSTNNEGQKSSSSSSSSSSGLSWLQSFNELPSSKSKSPSTFATPIAPKHNGDKPSDGVMEEESSSSSSSPSTTTTTNTPVAPRVIEKSSSIATTPALSSPIEAQTSVAQTPLVESSKTVKTVQDVNTAEKANPKAAHTSMPNKEGYYITHIYAYIYIILRVENNLFENNPIHHFISKIHIHNRNRDDKVC